MGMTSEDCAKLFRIDLPYIMPGTDGEKGSGLGLILCHELVERNNGWIEVGSESGRGSTFRFTLPKNRPADE